MQAEEIVEQIATQNRRLLSNNGTRGNLTPREVLELMNLAAMGGFRFGSECALSMVAGMLTIQQTSDATRGAAS